jgi:hypothetical protein
MHDPNKVQLLNHANGLQFSAGLSKVYKNQLEHDPSDMNRAREIASGHDTIPVGILYRNPNVPCYEDLRLSDKLRTPDLTRAGLNAELDKYTVWPQGAEQKVASGVGAPNRARRQNPTPRRVDYDMEADTQAHVVFFLTGRRPAEHLDAVDGLGLRPALFAGYRELSQLRYDFPLLLVAGRTDGQFAQSLSGLIDSALAGIARGSDSERIRKHALRLEQEIRTLAAGGASGTLSALWDKAAGRLAKGGRNAGRQPRSNRRRSGGLRRGPARVCCACLSAKTEVQWTQDLTDLR